MDRDEDVADGRKLIASNRIKEKLAQRIVARGLPQELAVAFDRAQVRDPARLRKFIDDGPKALQKTHVLHGKHQIIFVESKEKVGVGLNVGERVLF